MVEQQRPGGPRDDGRNHDRQYQQGDEYLPARQLFQEQLRHRQPEQQLDWQRDRGEDHRVQQGLPHADVVEQLRVVAQADEFGADLCHRDALEADDEQVDQRKNADQEQHEYRRSDQQVFEIAFGESRAHCNWSRSHVWSIRQGTKKGARRVLRPPPSCTDPRCPSGRADRSASLLLTSGRRRTWRPRRCKPPFAFPCRPVW